MQERDQIILLWDTEWSVVTQDTVGSAAANRRKLPFPVIVADIHGPVWGIVSLAIC